MTSSTVVIICAFLGSLVSAAVQDQDTITEGESIRDNFEETLTSSGNTFRLGFFGLYGDSGYVKYLGIWYVQPSPPTYVWVANRDKPLFHPNGVMAIAEDGNLKVMNESNSSFFSTDLPSSFPSNRTVQLLDNGNLVLIDKTNGKILWQSFDHPTDTFLRGMKMGTDMKLTSWNSTSDPRPGDFTFQLDTEEPNRYVIGKKNENNPRWKSRDSSSFNSNPVLASLLTNGSSEVKSRDSRRFNDYTATASQLPKGRLVMNSSGELQLWYLRTSGQWVLAWEEPKDKCAEYNACGYFGVCNSENRVPCKCLPGFVPQSPDDWSKGDFSNGCLEKTDACLNSTEYIFVDLKMMEYESPLVGGDNIQSVGSEGECSQMCKENCRCRAYSYREEGSGREHDTKCWTWTELKSLQENVNGGDDLSVRLPIADIESRRRNCKPCGANLIPYPISTEPGCGDPAYNFFSCNSTSGQVEFKARGSTYRVTSINPDSHTFTIIMSTKVKNQELCSGGNLRPEDLGISPTKAYYVNSSGCIQASSSVNMSVEVVLNWFPPPEPICASLNDCKDWPNSSCKRNTDGIRRCLCNENYRWNGSALQCTGGGPGNNPFQAVIISTVGTAVLVLIICICGYVWYMRRKKKQRQASRESKWRNQEIRLYDTEKRIRNFMDSVDFRDDDKKDIDVPFFDLESILSATDNFSNENKLGQGGFGPVYKGMFPGGLEIAVKRLSRNSGQGLEEFKNEVILIAKLQHRNLVRLLGYCIKGDEKILLYEYMPNRSLDRFIFDRTLCASLEWKKRFDIILGIARGLLYLHHDSRLRIVHRDLKTSNILLDGELNPKISDFGLARIVMGKETAANTQMVVGTYGYMSPEYALDGLFSIKSDAFSFGVIILEIISGKRNTGVFKSHLALSLLGHAWSLWREGKAMELVDQALVESCDGGQAMKCIVVGLLCVQDDPSDRPTMADVIFMLGSEITSLPGPKEPSYVGKYFSTSSSSKQESLSLKELSVTVEEPR